MIWYGALAMVWVGGVTTVHQEPFTLVEQLRIGDRDGPHSLTTVSAVLPSGDGRTVYISQPREYLIRIFDAGTGRLIGAFGHKGAGPGEFEAISHISWKEDTLCVADKRQQRITFFTADGEHVRTRRIASAPLPATKRPALAVAMAPDGTVWAESVLSMTSVANGGVSVWPVVRLSQDGEVLSTVIQRNVAGTMQSVVYGTGVAVFRQPMPTRQIHAYAPDGSSLVFVDGPPPVGSRSEFIVTRLGYQGDTIYRRSFRYTPRTVPSQAHDSIYRAYAPAFSRGVTAAQAFEIAKRHIIIPAVQPPISDVVVASGGEAWLKREEINPSRRNTWIILAPNGEIRGTLETPGGLTIHAIQGETVWGVIRDEMDVPYVVRYQLRSRPPDQAR